MGYGGGPQRALYDLTYRETGDDRNVHRRNRTATEIRYLAAELSPRITKGEIAFVLVTDMRLRDVTVIFFEVRP